MWRWFGEREKLSRLRTLSGKTHFRSISLCYNYLFFVLRRLHMKNMVNIAMSWDWSALPASILLRGKVYFGLRQFGLFYLSLSLYARLHINTTPGCSSPAFFSELFVELLEILILIRWFLMATSGTKPIIVSAGHVYILLHQR